MKWVLGVIALALCAFGSSAQAQVPDPACNERTVGETVLACPDGLYEMLSLSDGRILAKIEVHTTDLRSCRGSTILGVFAIRCSDGLFEWRRVNGRRVLQRIPLTTSPETERQIYLDRTRELQSGYGYVPPECAVFIERNTQRCGDARWRRDNVTHCYGSFSGRPVREAEVCLRWREQRRNGY